MSGECEVVQCDDMSKSNLSKTGLRETLKVNDIYQDIYNERNLEIAYELISNKKGSNTKGIGNETLDSYSKDTIKSVSESLKNHQFKFKPIRRVYIPKPNGKLRPLGIPSPRDKVVQKSIVMALERIYENKFLECSYGFRPKRGTHSAIKEVTG